MSEIIKEELPHKLDVTYSSQLSEEVKIVIKANSKERSELPEAARKFGVERFESGENTFETQHGRLDMLINEECTKVLAGYRTWEPLTMAEMAKAISGMANSTRRS